MKIRECGIYKITNIVTKDYYIGSADNIYRRECEHRRKLSLNKHVNHHLQNAWNKYGADNFEFSTILICDIENKLYFEQAILDGLKPKYNIAPCAKAPGQGVPQSDEARRKKSEALKGRIVTEETKRKLSEASKGNTSFRGHKHTEESKQKMREASMGNTSRLGKKHTEESKQKMREAKRNRS